MVVSCVAVNCSNSRKNLPELSFHRLQMLNDGNREIRKRWLANVKRHGTLPKENYFFYVLTILSLASKEYNFISYNSRYMLLKYNFKRSLICLLQNKTYLFLSLFTQVVIQFILVFHILCTTFHI